MLSYSFFFRVKLEHIIKKLVMAATSCEVRRICTLSVYVKTMTAVIQVIAKIMSKTRFMG